MKKLIIAIIAVTVSAMLLLGGCVNLSGVDGKDGRDGKDVSIREIFEEANNERKKDGLEELDFLEFIEEYLNYDSSTIENSVSLQTNINNSLRSAVSVRADFTVTSYSWGKPITQTQTYFGGGVIIDLDKESGNALAVTNCHVVYNENATKRISQNVYLYLYGQDDDYTNPNCAISAKVIGASQTYDIALLKVENNDILKNSDALAANFDKSDDVYTGETVYAIGNPEGYGMSATQGIISKESETISINLSSSAYLQNIKEYRVIRTDAAINSGNSGGGLFNRAGKLVGIVNSKSGESDVDNMGFALPSSNVRRLVNLMLDSYNSNGFSGSNGIVRAYLKAEYTSQPKASKWNESKGVYEIYESVSINVAADGLEVGDSVRAIKLLDGNGDVVEDREVTRLYHLDDVLLSARTGYTAEVTVSRGGSEQVISVPITASHFVSMD